MDTFPIVENIIVQKPKKSFGNSYTCPIYYQSRKNAYTLLLSRAKVVKVSRLSNLDDLYLFLRIPQVYNYFFDINHKIVEIVKNCSGEWFNNNMNPELIEDYYTSTLVYDKNYGDVLKLKVVGGDYQTLEKLNQKDTDYDITITLTNLRFFKQKFVLETRVDNHAVHTGFSFIDSDGEDGDLDEPESLSDVVASPSHEEVQEIRSGTLRGIEVKMDEVREKIENLTDKLKELDVFRNEEGELIKKKEFLENLHDDFEILKYCQEETI